MTGSETATDTGDATWATEAETTTEGATDPDDVPAPDQNPKPNLSFSLSNRLLFSNHSGSTTQITRR